MATLRGIRRRAGALLGVVVLTAVTGAYLLPTGVSAAGAGAVTVKGTACSIALSDDPLVAGVGVAAIKVENSANVVLKCTARRGALVNETGHTQTYRGFDCYIRSPVPVPEGETPPIYYTTDTSATVTADGGAETTCRYAKP
jgi:hypothetical protein